MKTLSLVLLLLSLAPAASTQIVFEVRADTDIAGGGLGVRSATGDVDGDGDVDVITTTQLLRNTGDGSFAPPVDLGWAFSDDLALGLFDGDNHLDIARSDPSGAWVHLGDGNGGFDAGTLVQAKGLNPFRTIVVADVTGDGEQDLVTASGEVIAGQMEVSLLIGAGDGSFAPPALIQGPAGNLYPMEVVVGDLDDDGSPDLLLLANTLFESSLLVFQGQGGGVPVSVDFIGLGPDRALDMRLSDVTGDGDLDLLIGGLFGFATFAGEAGLDLGPAKVWDTRPMNDGISLGDVDGDGFDDIAFTNLSTWEKVVLTGAADGSFTEVWTMTGFGSSYDGETIDFDGDGRLDLGFGAISGSGSKLYTVLRNHTYLPGEPWLDVGLGLASDEDEIVPGKPVLWADGTLGAGDEITITMARNKAPPNQAWLILGATDLFAPFKGGVLVPSADVVIGPFTAPWTIPIEVVGTVPAGLPPGVPFWLQAWYSPSIFSELTEFAASNAVCATTP